MASFLKIGTWDQAGYDEGRALQILPVGQQTTFYIVADTAGADPSVSVDDAGLVSLTVEGSLMLKVTVMANNNQGQTTLRARLNGKEVARPITLRLLHDPYWRQVGKALGECTPEIRKEIQILPLRQAVLRVAEDQMHSSIAWRSNGYGVYNIDKDLDWCGAFAFWCWQQAAAIKGVTDPLGRDSTVLWSPQRAISWGINPATPGQLLRYRGGNPFTGAGTQEYREIGWNSCRLEPADIVLLREGHAGGWKHVCMVDQDLGANLRTMDGNQSPNRSFPPPSIKRVTRSRDEKLADGSYKLAFLHVLPRGVSALPTV